MQLVPLSPQLKRDLLFAELDLPVPDKRAWVERFSRTPEDWWFWDHDRETHVLPLRNRSADFGYAQNENIRFPEQEFKWTAAAFPDLVAYFENQLKPWVGVDCRMAVLRTRPGHRNKEHIDCAPHEMGTVQHKFRMVLQGRTDSLYFLTANGHVRAPSVEGPFIMDGGWAHGMHNAEAEEKYTLVLGAPWKESQMYPQMRNVLTREGLVPLERLEVFFNERYRIDLGESGGS